MDNQVRQQISDALETLNRTARENKDEVKAMVRERFGQMRDILGEQKGLLMGKIMEGRERVNEKITHLDSKVKNNPWPFVATAAASSFILGILYSNNKKCR